MRFDGRFAHLPHFGAKHIIGVAVDREGHILPFDNLADVGLVDGCFDLHLGGIGGDFEQIGCLKTGRNSSAWFNQLVDDDAACGRNDNGAVQIKLCG